jgi:CheY-like chemotaxis protein
MVAIATAPFASRRVLLIEDDLDDAYLIKKALQALERDKGTGFQLTHLRNGLEAISFVGKSDLLGQVPDVVIVDLNMPVMDGQRFIGALRSVFELKGIWTVVLTTSDQKAIHDQARGRCQRRLRQAEHARRVDRHFADRAGEPRGSSKLTA